jgi:hypothetical protein
MNEPAHSAEDSYSYSDMNGLSSGSADRID